MADHCLHCRFGPQAQIGGGLLADADAGLRVRLTRAAWGRRDDVSYAGDSLSEKGDTFVQKTLCIRTTIQLGDKADVISLGPYTLQYSVLHEPQLAEHWAT